MSRFGPKDFIRGPRGNKNLRLYKRVNRDLTVSINRLEAELRGQVEISYVQPTHKGGK